MSDTTLTPDQDFSGNELICEKLLRWKRSTHKGDFFQQWYDMPHGDDGAQWHTRGTPSFTTWAEAGLILEAMGRDHHIDFGKNSHGNERWFCAFENTSNTPLGEDYAETGPLAIRAAALDYVRRWK